MCSSFIVLVVTSITVIGWGGACARAGKEHASRGSQVQHGGEVRLPRRSQILVLVFLHIFVGVFVFALSCSFESGGFMATGTLGWDGSLSALKFHNLVGQLQY